MPRLEIHASIIGSEAFALNAREDTYAPMVGEEACALIVVGVKYAYMVGKNLDALIVVEAKSVHIVGWEINALIVEVAKFAYTGDIEKDVLIVVVVKYALIISKDMAVKHAPQLNAISVAKLIRNQNFLDISDPHNTKKTIVLSSYVSLEKKWKLKRCLNTNQYNFLSILWLFVYVFYKT